MQVQIAAVIEYDRKIVWTGIARFTKLLCCLQFSPLFFFSQLLSRTRLDYFMCQL